MDYKKLFKDPESRIKIMQALSFVPDRTMLKLQYRIQTGRKLDLNSPHRYSEKIQLYKISYRDPIMAECVDKYSVRKYIEKRIGSSYLNELYGVYDDPEDIDFTSLPSQFVLKDTLGGGELSMIIVTDKDSLNFNEAIKKMKKWVNEPINKKNAGREWVYDGRKHRIIAEKLLSADSNGDLPDYKFFCFDGEVFCSYMMMNYTRHHEEGILGFFDKNFTLLPVRRADFANPMTVQPPKPINYDKMVELAEVLSKGFPHVRVDFYNIAGEIIFGELTFYTGSGYVQFDPDSFDYELGQHFILPRGGGTIRKN